MKRTRNLTLLSLATLVVACLCLAATALVAARSAGGILARTVNRDPQTVAKVGSGIATYDLPAGFGDGYAADLAGFSLVAYTGSDARSHITLVQIPGRLTLDQATIEGQMRQVSGTDEWSGLTVVERQPCRIRGEETTLVVSEGLNHEDQRYRSASATFTGNGGAALVNISMPASRWDQTTIDAFIASLH